MLDLLEKFAIGVGGFFVFVTGGLYLNLFSILGLPTGVPTTSSKEFIRSVEEVRPPRTASTGPKTAPSKPSTAEQRIISQLQKQGRRVLPGRGLQTKEFKVENDLYEHVSAEANWASEINKAHSRIIESPNGNTRLQVFNIEDDSLLEYFGFQDEDVVELIDGEIIEFDQRSTRKYYGLAKQLLGKLREGGEISVTVSRRNRPVHMKFSLRN